MNQTTSRMVRLCALSILVAAPVSAQLPDAKQIVDRSIRASGGAAVIRKHTNIYMSGKFELPAQAITGTIHNHGTQTTGSSPWSRFPPSAAYDPDMTVKQPG
jgi:hypothetical protein